MDPTLLPEPNHVVLNHTFTLSIRVSIMFLSSFSCCTVHYLPGEPLIDDDVKIRCIRYIKMLSFLSRVPVCLMCCMSPVTTFKHSCNKFSEKMLR